MSTSLSGNRLFPNPLETEINILAEEVMVFCPACKAFETVWFTDGTLNQTRKFIQYGKHVYHDCGSNEPCKLYMTV